MINAYYWRLFMNQYDDIFYKPFIQDIYPGSPSSGVRHFPYPRDFFKSAPIFSTVVLDGGAFFFAKETFGTID